MRLNPYILAAVFIFTLFYGCAVIPVKTISAEKAAPETKAVPVPAADASQNTSDAKNNSAPKSKFRVKELVINSDTMNYNKETSEAVFHGNVSAEASNILINCDMLKSTNYKDNAEAYGNVRAFYKEQGVTINCGKMIYKDKLTGVNAFDDVVTRKVLQNGETIIMKSEELVFNAADNTLYAKKVKKRIRITLKDIIAFCDEVSYNDTTRELEMKGNPMVKKSKSILMADVIDMNVDKKSMNMKKNIWTKIFYRDFETTRKEAAVDKNKNRTPDKNIQ
jgi:lipopolysaccharide export system protein LptA